MALMYAILAVSEVLIDMHTKWQVSQKPAITNFIEFIFVNYCRSNVILNETNLKQSILKSWLLWKLYNELINNFKHVSY